MRTIECLNCGVSALVRASYQRYCRAAACQRAMEVMRRANWKAKNPEATRQRQLRDNRARNDRYWSDPEYRERRKAIGRAKHQRRREEGVSEHHVVPYEVFAKMLADQEGICAICRRAETAKDPSGRVKRLAVDHDRVTGEIRGLLCARCNTAIGLLQHDPHRTQAAVDYLVKHVLREQRAAVASLNVRRKG